MAGRAVDPRARHRARRALMQALYAWQLTGAEFADLRGQFTAEQGDGDAPPSLGGHGMRRADTAYFLDCLRGVMANVETLDPIFAPHLDRAVDRLDGVERAILRAGVYELKDCLEVPARVVINEWVEVAKGFGAEESFRYINGVLDKVAHELRANELDQAAP